MAKVCSLTGKRVIRGNNVSHAKNRTRRSFEPNLQHVRLYSNALKRHIRLRIAASTIRTLDKKGGLDQFLLTRRAILLGVEARKLKKKITKAIAKTEVGGKAITPAAAVATSAADLAPASAAVITVAHESQPDAQPKAQPD